jgi:hypothetical protein
VVALGQRLRHFANRIDTTVGEAYGERVRRVRSGATLDNEENYLIKKLCGGGLGLVWVENQARV